MVSEDVDRRELVAKSLLAAALLTIAPTIASLSACSSSPAGDDDPGTPDAGDSTAIDAADKSPDAAPAKPALQHCVGGAFTPEPATAFKHGKPSGGASHWGIDTIATQKRTASARFGYGALNSALKDETIKAWFWDCKAWQPLGEVATDQDGRVALAFPDGQPPGSYDVRYEVMGDASLTSSTVWSLPAGTHIVVSDIDGTLTTGDSEFIKQVATFGSYDPKGYPGGPELLDAHAVDGQIVVFLTGRPFNFTQWTRDWLVEKKFTAGPLRLTESIGDAFPSESGVGEYKKAFLNSLVDDGFVLDLAYGNASTDISAYFGAGLLADKVWIIGSNAGDEGTHPVTDTWAPRAAEVVASPAIEQPFSY
jgi:hypothetical protein